VSNQAEDGEFGSTRRRVDHFAARGHPLRILWVTRLEEPAARCNHEVDGPYDEWRISLQNHGQSTIFPAAGSEALYRRNEGRM
jgi:hypothetical protein